MLSIPPSIDRNDDGHDPKTRSANCDEIVVGIARRLLAVTGKPADRMRALPEIARCLALHDVQQRFFVEFGKVACGE
ncbi:hypothetical protein LHFGNBLO_006035 (plasmid) [Mesorhizobium sp. AR10]|uniref:hypothetical protein n=1 Tax=Mesorhizobium sp. AR10 TaxID=2865839 RepID=UPI002160B881|nr:hypothetical protein [Mesorhizobium sp. AR10]UVK35820.1 hypothetical protein LHFGNBLO_006035 [Mesorhizobium sp. AR10]